MHEDHNEDLTAFVMRESIKVLGHGRSVFLLDDGDDDHVHDDDDDDDDLVHDDDDGGGDDDDDDDDECECEWAGNGDAPKTPFRFPPSIIISIIMIITSIINSIIVIIFIMSMTHI